ncbi:MAG: alpha/beta fold hydrolase [Dehalococcoidia bacterium]
MAEITHRTIQTNGINMHIAEAGSGPLVVLCHGWPESWYSWRHQLVALADAGYHAVAPDQRGYGQTDKPEAIDQYSQLHMVGDIVGLLDALKEETTVIVGHDWGAPVAWNSALLRPDRFPAVVGMSVPYGPRGDFKPTDGLKMAFGDNFFYILYFQQPGVAEAELEADVAKTMKMLMFSASGDIVRTGDAMPVRPAATTKFLDGMEIPESLPAWLSEADLAYFVGEFKRTGFRGGLNWYRNLDRNWELMGAWRAAKVTVPALFITGEKDVVRSFAPEDTIRQNVPNLKDLVLVPGAGHWVQQERPDEVNKALIGFLKSL